VITKLRTSVRQIFGWLWRSLAVAAGVALAFLIREPLAHHHPGFAPFITFYPAVLLAALLGGLWTGILATVLCALVAGIWIFSPTGKLAVRDPYDVLSLAIFCVFGIALSIILELYRRNREKLVAYQVEDAISSERRKAEEERQKAESAGAERQRLLDVLETLPAMVSLLTTDHRVTFANRSFREKYGEPCGEPCFKVRHGRSEPCVPCETFFPLHTGEPHHREVIFRDGSLIDAYDYPFTDLDGSSTILEVGVDITERRRAETELEQYREHLEALVQERTHQLQATNAQLEADIKVREQVEETLRESRAKLAAALASMTDSVLITDAEGRFVDFNDAYATFYRFRNKDECARNFAEFSSLVEVCTADGEPASQEMYAMRRALRGETAIGVEYKLRRRDSGETWVGSISFSPIRDKDGVITGSVITARDITEAKRAEKVIETTLQRFYIILSNLSSGILLVTNEGRIEFANQAFCDLFRLRESPADLVATFDSEKVIAKIDTAYENPVQAALRVREIVKQGQPVLSEELPIQNGCMFIRDFVPLTVDGKSYGRMWVHTDITDSKRREEALRQSEKRYRNLFNSMNEGFCVIEVLFDAEGRPEDYRFLEVNDAFEKQTGLHDAVGKRMRELAPDHEEHWFEIYGRIALTGEAQHFMNEAKALNRVYDVYAYRVGEPELRRVAIVFNDFSDYKRAEDALRASEEQFRNLANAIPQLCWMANADGWLFWYNERWYEYTGTTPQQMEGWGWQSVHDPEALPLVMERWKDSIATGKPFDMVFPLRRADGVFRPFLTRVMPVKDAEGKVGRWFGTNTDITERKRAEEQLTKLNRTLKALSNSNQALMRAEDESAFLNEVCRIVTDDCGHAMVWIGFAEHDDCKTVRAVAHAGFDNGYLETLQITWGDGERGQGPTGTAIRTGQPAMCRDMRADPAFAPWRDEAVKWGYASSLAMPLKERGEAWGAITIYSRETDAFTEGEVKLLTELAGDVESGIELLRVRAAHAQAAENLRESESRLGLFIEHAPAALAMFDKRMCYLRASRRWRADYGLGDRDLNDVSHYDVFPEVPEEWKEAHRRGMAGEVVRADADRFQRADGSEQWIRWEVFPWRDAEGQVGGIVIFSEDITQRKQAEAALFENQKMAMQREQLHALAVRQQRAREEERTKVSRDLHDQIGQILTAIKMDVTWMGRRLAKTQGPVRERLAGTVELINDGIRSVRRICTGLRPGVLDDLGLAAAIEWQANEFASRTGIPCQVSATSGDLHLDGEQATAFFRIFQECLTNVSRHAKARSVRVSLHMEGGNLLMVVRDDGKGFRESEASGSLGILGMKERALVCGGDLQISSSPGNGTTVTLSVPIRSAGENGSEHAHIDSR
jgi:PAS domain S-box-containing protein